MIRRNNKVIYLKNAKRRTKKEKGKRIFLFCMICVAAGIGLLIALLPNAYQISIDGEVIGALRQKESIEKAIETVKVQLENQYDTEVKLEENYEITKVRAAKKDLITVSYLTSKMRKQLSFLLKVYALKVDGEEVGIIASKELVTELKEGLEEIYFEGEEVETRFVNEVTTEPIFAREEAIMTLEEITEKVTQSSKKEIEYEVVKGDTLSGIVNKLGITMTRLLKANEGMDESSVIRIGMILKAEIDVPVLELEKLETVETENKEEVEEGSYAENSGH